MELIAWLVAGFVAGAVARLLVPVRDPMGLGGTLGLGLVGSLIGGFAGTILVRGDEGFSPAGLIGSIVGAVIALLAYRAALSRRTA
ncbi:MAG TPA: GlsB/YeaQ/YmgE family stress response membrane protein [Actinomycetota bacterium]